MSEQNIGNRQIREAVTIDAMRVFDSCCSQDCLEDLEFSFDTASQSVINNAAYIKSKCIEVTSVAFAIDPVPFNKGFYSVNVTYNFNAEIEAYTLDSAVPTVVFGTASFSKTVILYGSEAKAQRFISTEAPAPSVASPVSGCTCCCDCSSLPTAAVNIAAPMCLDAQLLPAIPPSTDKIVTITIGIFAIIQLERPVSILMPAYDYSLPGSECPTNTDTPCEMFSRISFPVNEFFPQGIDNDNGQCGCDSQNNSNNGGSQNNTASNGTNSSSGGNYGSGGRMS